MPMYEYECNEGHVTEELISVTCTPDNENRLSPICSTCGRLTKRIMSAIALTPTKWGDTKSHYHGV